MRRIPKAIAAIFCAAAVLAAAGWITSYFRWAVVGSFPWPSSGFTQTHDAGSLVLANGRIFLVRQRVMLSPSGTAPMPTLVDREPPRADGTFLSADSRQLGTLKVTINSWKGMATTESSGSISVGPLQDDLERISWRRLGFSSQPLAVPRMVMPGVVITATWTATAIPLWPFVLLGAPAAWMMLRGRRSRRWVEQGRCGACGYDLRQSPERCPECGAPAPPAVEAEPVPA